MAEPADARRWRTLAILATAQLMTVIDLTVVNVAIPYAQRSLHIPDADRQWIVTAYGLAFGSLLLMGGRIADYWGRKRTLITGMIGFAVASAFGGAAQNGIELFTARALQGAFAALLAPAALSLLHVTFPSGKDRTRAFSIYGAVSGGGAAFGSALGGLITEYANWRWCLYVNVPVVLIGSAFALLYISESRTDGKAHYDMPGAITAIIGSGATVFGLTKAAQNGWASPATIAPLAAGLFVLAVFLVIELRTPHPLIPLRLVVHATRGGCYIAGPIATAALTGWSLYITFYLEITLGYSPARTGSALLVSTLMFMIGARVVEPLTRRFTLRQLVISGCLIGSVGTALFTRITVDGDFVTRILPAQIILGGGMACVFIPLTQLAMTDVPNRDAGVGGGLFSAIQQIGGAIGLAVFGTIFAAATSEVVGRHPVTDDVVKHAQVHGYRTVFWVTAGALLSAAFIVSILVRQPRVVATDHPAVAAARD